MIKKGYLQDILWSDEKEECTVHLLHEDGGQERRNIHEWPNKYKIYLKDKQQQKRNYI